MNDYETPLDIIRRRYPNALSTSDTVDRFLDLVRRRLGIAPSKIMLAASICSDDLESIELPRRDRIASARCAMAESTEVMYSAIEQRIDVLASRTQYPCRYLIIMGGVLINSDYDVGSFCSFRRLVCVDLTTGRRENWLDEL